MSWWQILLLLLLIAYVVRGIIYAVEQLIERPDGEVDPDSAGTAVVVFVILVILWLPLRLLCKLVIEDEDEVIAESTGL